MVSFEELPPELRQQIFELVFLDNIRVCFVTQSGKWRLWFIPPKSNRGTTDPHCGGYDPRQNAVWCLLKMDSYLWIPFGDFGLEALSPHLTTPAINLYAQCQREYRHAQVLRVCKTWYRETQWIFRRDMELVVLPSPLTLVVPEIEEYKEFTIHLPWKLEDMDRLKDQLGDGTLSGIEHVTIDLVGVAMSTWQVDDSRLSRETLERRVKVIVERYLKPMAKKFTEMLPGLMVLHIIEKKYASIHDAERDETFHVQRVGAYVSTMLAYWIETLTNLKEVKVLRDPTLDCLNDWEKPYEPRLQRELEEVIASGARGMTDQRLL